MTKDKIRLYKVLRKWGLPASVALFMVKNQYKYWLNNIDMKVFE